MNPPDLRYSEEHEWVRLESEDIATIGITAFAVESLGDIVFLDLPQADTDLARSEKLGEVESVKAVSDIYSPLSGRVIERNEDAIENPQAVNDNPYEDGWLLKVAVSHASEVESLMTAEQYEAFLASQEEA